ncbi:MAG: class A beta-lactamase-related serine hydrolase [Gemmatimonadetes bacterium]|nr:class A beta-lactamase-related serine hydrolase [Gemmatimonadota bacterium]
MISTRRALAILLCSALSAQAPLRAQRTAATVRADALWAAMADSINAITRAVDATFGVSIVDLTDGRSFDVNGDSVFKTASTIKIAILAELFRQDGGGSARRDVRGDGAPPARLDDPYTVDRKDLVGGSGIMGRFSPGVTRLTNRDLAAMMVSVSDNSATNILIERVGMENVNALFSARGLAVTRLRRNMMDTKAAEAGRENTASPREFSAFLVALHRGDVLGTPLTEEFFRLLSLGKASYIPRFIPGNVRIANKPGELGGVRNDAGVVFVAGRPFAISMFTIRASDERAAENAIARIAFEAWKCFDTLARN